MFGIKDGIGAIG